MAMANADDLLGEFAAAVAKEDHHTRRGVVHALRPVAHLAYEDIEIPKNSPATWKA